MSNEVEAIFENGVFRPVEPVKLPENHRVIVQIPDVDPIGESNGQRDVPANVESDDEPDPVWRGVFATEPPRNALITKSFNLEEDLPQRTFDVEMDWYRVIDDE